MRIKSFLKIFVVLLLMAGVLTPLLAPHIVDAQSRNPRNVDGSPALQFQQTPSCGILKFFSNLKECLKYTVANMAYQWLWLMSWVLWASSVVLNYVLYYTVVTMSSNIKNMQGITSAWEALRDLANMTFIFILLYAAIGQILQLSGVNAGRMVKDVVIAALLINFSMFFAKVIIDASNVLALGFYDAITGGGVRAITSLSNILDAGGLSDAFMRPLGITSIFDASAVEKMAQYGYGAVIINSLAGSLLIIIASFIFLAVAFMFLVRYVILIFLIILSPLAFVGNAIPYMKQYSSKWFNTLIGQALFAPVYFMMTWVVLRIMSGGGFLHNNAEPTARAGGSTASYAQMVDDAGAIALIMNFAIVIMFLVGTLVIAKQFATAGGGMASSLMNKATGAAGATMFGAGAALGRRTIGRSWNERANSDVLKERAANAKGLKGFYYRNQLKVAKKMGGASFDMRNTGLGDTIGANKGTILGMGGVKSGGYAKMAADKKSEQEEYKKIRLQEQAKSNIQKGTDAQDSIDAKKAKGQAITQEEEDAVRAGASSLQKLDDKGVEALGKDKLKSKFVAKNISPQKFAALVANKEGKWKDEDIAEFKKARYGELYEAIESKKKNASSWTPQQVEDAERNIQKLTQSLSNTDLEVIDSKYHGETDFVRNLTNAQRDYLTNARNSNISSAQKDLITNTYVAPVKAALALDRTKPSNVAQMKRAFKTLRAKEIAALDVTDKGMLNPEILHAYDKKTLTELANTLTISQRQALRKAILAAPLPPAPATGKKKKSKLEEMQNWLNHDDGKDLFS